MRYLSLFSGIEAATVAWEPLGWEAVAFCEVDEFPSAVLAIVCMADDNANAAIDFDMCGYLKVGGSAPAVADGYTLRRLTPRECERLQGFPDDHMLIPYRGKTAGECPDTPRYKALGNSMAVPVMAWIGRRLEAIGV